MHDSHRYRVGRTVEHTLYEQTGPEPSDDDVFIGSAITGHKAGQLVEAANRGLKAVAMATPFEQLTDAQRALLDDASITVPMQPADLAEDGGE